MPSTSARITNLERALRKQAREEFSAAVNADFATALKRAASNDAIRSQLEIARKDFIKSGVRDAEEEALKRFLAERAPEPQPTLIDIGALYNPVEIRIGALYNPVEIRIGADGKRLPDTAENHVAVLYPQFVYANGLSPLYSVRAEVLPNWQAAVDAGPKFELFNDKGEWQLWDDVQASLTINRRANNPAVNPAFAKHTPTDEIYWTRTQHPSSSDDAFYVNLRLGRVSWSLRGYRGRARFVRLVPASQF